MALSNKDRNRSTVWVANLQDDLTRTQIIHLFEKYGSVHNIVRKGNFASVEFDNPNDAIRARHGLDQVDYYGRRLGVDWYRGGGDKYPTPDVGTWWGGKRGQPRMEHRVCVLGVPSIWTFHDLRTLAWEAGFSVIYCTISRSRCGFKYGIVEYAHYDDYKYALDYLDGKEIKTSDGRTKMLRIIKADQLPAVEAHVAENGLPKQERTEPKVDPKPQGPSSHTSAHASNMNTIHGPTPTAHHGGGTHYPPHGAPPSMPPPHYYDPRSYPPPQSYGHGPPPSTDYAPPM